MLDSGPRPPWRRDGDGDPMRYPDQPSTMMVDGTMNNHVETAADAARVRPFADRQCNKMYDIELLLERVVRESSE